MDRQALELHIGPVNSYPSGQVASSHATATDRFLRRFSSRPIPMKEEKESPCQARRILNEATTRRWSRVFRQAIPRPVPASRGRSNRTRLPVRVTLNNNPPEPQHLTVMRPKRHIIPQTGGRRQNVDDPGTSRSTTIARKQTSDLGRRTLLPSPPRWKGITLPRNQQATQRWPRPNLHPICRNG